MNNMIIQKLKDRESIGVRAEWDNLRPGTPESRAYLLGVRNGILDIADETSPDFVQVLDEVERLVTETGRRSRDKWAQ